MELENKINKYSKFKTFGVIPFSILAIISIVVFGLVVIISPIYKVPEQIMYISAICMMSGIIIPMIVLTISERIRNNLIDIDVMDYIKFISKDEPVYEYVYYDLIDILLGTLRTEYLKQDSKSQQADIINILNKIVMEEHKVGLANKFVYNRKAFSELCNYIIDKSNDNVVNLGADIYTKYKDLKSQYSNTKTKYMFKKIEWSLLTKKFFLGLCCVGFWFPKYNSWLFNFVAIVLLFLEIFEKEKTNK